jgi:Coenzyme PQQ synthesis protein D (PqqD)
MDPSSRPKPREGYVLEAFGSELVIFHPATEAIFYCNASAALIFRLCDGQRDIATIRRLLVEAYPDAAERMQEDLTATLQRLLDHQAIELT